MQRNGLRARFLDSGYCIRVAASGTDVYFTVYKIHIDFHRVMTSIDGILVQAGKSCKFCSAQQRRP